MTTLLLIFVAGGLGSLARFGLDNAVKALDLGDFPYGTSLINVLGCFLFGLVVGGVSHGSDLLTEQRALILTVGFLGAFTTFSTFAYEAQSFLGQSRWVPFALYLVAQNVLGILFLAAGLRLMR